MTGHRPPRYHAARRGEQGAGDEVFAADLLPTTINASVHDPAAPADFTNVAQILEASSAVLHGKITRGGMRTSMPYWGPILTDEQVWALISYLWSLQFEYGPSSS